MNICLQVMYKPTPYTNTGDPLRDNRVYRKGDIMEIYRNSKCTGAMNPNSNSVFIRVMGVPISALKKIKRLRNPIYNDDGFVIEICRWYLPRIKNNNLPASIKATLDSELEYTLTWDQIKGEVKRKDLDSFITDSDVS